MNPFLVEPVYKRPKRKPAAKKKPAVKRKAPAKKKPAAKRRVGGGAVYIEDYVTPHDPIGLWSATPRDILPPKVSGKVPVLIDDDEAEAHEPQRQALTTNKEKSSRWTNRLMSGVTTIGSAAYQGVSAVGGLAAAAAFNASAGGGQPGPSSSSKERVTLPQQEDTVKQTPSLKPGATVEERKAHVAHLFDIEEAKRKGKAKAVDGERSPKPPPGAKRPAIDLAALEAETTRREAEAAGAAAGGSSSVDIGAMLDLVEVPQSTTVETRAKELRKLASVTESYLESIGENPSPKFTDAAGKSQPARYKKPYVDAAEEWMGGMRNVMALQNKEVLKELTPDLVKAVRRVAIGQPQGTSALIDAQVSKTKALNDEHVKRALVSLELEGQPYTVAEVLEGKRQASQRRTTRKRGVTRPRR